MGLFCTVNVPDNSMILGAINGNLHEIAENTKQMGYSLKHIEEDIARVADASEVVAGIVSKEEVIARKRYYELLDDYTCMDEFDEYDKWNEDAQKEHDDKQAELSRIERFLKECKKHRTDFLHENHELLEEEWKK